MRWINRLRRALADLFQRDRFERDLNDELAAFLEMDAEARRRAGADTDAAERAARRELGGLDQARERLRDQRTGVRLDTFWQDARYGVRLLRRNPGFAAVAVLTLAIGIGANTAIFSVVSSVLLAPLPFPESERLVRLHLTQQQAGGVTLERSVSPAYFHGVRDRSRLLEHVAAQRYRNVNLTGDGEPERLVGIGVSDGWLDTLGVRPMLGRAFDAAEERAGSSSRAVLMSYGLWQRRFGGTSDVLGRQLRLNAEQYTVVGVMPPAFRYPYDADLWMPMSFSPTALGPGDLNVAARMRRGATLGQLRDDLDAVAGGLASELPGSRDLGIGVRPFHLEFRRDPDGSVAALLVAVGFVLLLACVNVANLLVSRGASRAREVAMRAALGAGRARQIRQLLTESLVLAAAGGLAGVLLAVWVSDWLAMLIPSRVREVIQEVRLDGGVLGAAAALCLVSGLVFGLAPAWRITRRSGLAMLRDGGRPGAPGGGRLPDLLVVAEVALALVLLVGAGVMTQHLARLLAAGAGYDTERLLQARLSLPQATYSDAARRIAAVDRIVEELEATPGVAGAAITTLQPIPRTTTNTLSRLTPDTLRDATERPPIVNVRMVTPGYFDTLGIRVQRGRGFAMQDTEGAAPVLVVNEAAARRFWPGEDPIGRRAWPGAPDADGVVWHEVVGVVSDIVEPSVEFPETIYQVYAQGTPSQPPESWPTTSVFLLVRTEGEPAGLLPSIRDAVWRVDAAIPLFDVMPMEVALAEPLSDERLGNALFLAFGAFGLLMAVLGTYGVLALAVSRRSAEFGIRLALGAAPGSLVRMVLSHGLRLLAAGLGLGLVTTLALGRVVRSVVAELDPWNPLAFGLASVLLLAAGAMACWLPAHRATRVDPLTVLRAE